MGRDHGNRQRIDMLAGLALALITVAPPVLGHPDHDDDRGAVFAQQTSSDPKIRIDDVHFTDSGMVSGVLVNQTADVLREVRLLVRYDWQWSNERNPGEDSPARSTYFTITSDVPALGTLPFRFSPRPALPIRSDGHFAPSIEVARYTQVRYEKTIKKLGR